MLIKIYKATRLAEVVRYEQDGVTVRKFYNNGQIEKQECTRAGKFHALDMPAVVQWHKNSGFSSIEYYLAGQHHRISETGPAHVLWAENGKIIGIAYWQNGKFHRAVNLGPALEMWYPGGQPRHREYIEHGQHQEDPGRGPSSEI